ATTAKAFGSYGVQDDHKKIGKPARKAARRAAPAKRSPSTSKAKPARKSPAKTSAAKKPKAGGRTVRARTRKAAGA
ncbi:MAG: ribosome silencing factor, partial [Pseudomonadota bacterium]